MRRILPTFSKLSGHVFRPISLVVLISFDDKSNSVIRESKFSNNPFHFYFASLPFLPKTIVNLVDLLKWLYHAIRYIFKKLNLSSHQWTSKILAQFCYLRLYLGNETVSCRLLLWMARMEMD